MCLLTFFPDGVQPNADALLRGTFFNDDGHGYAIVDRVGNRIITDRGMEADDMIDSFCSMRERYPHGPALFHSRFGTDGLISSSNVHPFEVGGDRRTVLAHNGVMPAKARPSATDPRSDTRIVAEEIIPKQYGGLRRRKARLAFERWMGATNKIVILTVNPRYRDNAFILNEKEGIWDEGIWYSNSGYMPYKPLKPAPGFTVVGGTGNPAGWREKAYVDYIGGKCWVCEEPAKPHQGECELCGFCFDCLHTADFCDCYVPSRRLERPSTDLMIWHDGD